VPKVAKAKKTVEGSVISITFNDADSTVVALDVMKCLPEIQLKLALHGASQKGGDSYAGVGDDIPAAIVNATRVFKDLIEGNWTTRVSGVGGPRITLLAEALARVGTMQAQQADANAEAITLEQALAVIEMLSDEDKKDMRADPQIKAVSAEIKLERAQAEAEKVRAEAAEAGEAATTGFDFAAVAEAASEAAEAQEAEETAEESESA